MLSDLADFCCETKQSLTPNLHPAQQTDDGPGMLFRTVQSREINEHLHLVKLLSGNEVYPKSFLKADLVLRYIRQSNGTEDSAAKPEQ